MNNQVLAFSKKLAEMELGGQDPLAPLVSKFSGGPWIDGAVDRLPSRYLDLDYLKMNIKLLQEALDKARIWRYVLDKSFDALIYAVEVGGYPEIVNVMLPILNIEIDIPALPSLVTKTFLVYEEICLEIFQGNEVEYWEIEYIRPRYCLEHDWYQIEHDYEEKEAYHYAVLMISLMKSWKNFQGSNKITKPVYLMTCQGEYNYGNFVELHKA